MPNPIKDAPWFIPTKTIHLPDGSTLIKPGKAIQRAKAADCARMTGVQRKSLASLAECGLIRSFRPTPKGTCYYPGEIMELINRTESDPDFWDRVRTAAYLTGTRLRLPD